MSKLSDEDLMRKQVTQELDHGLEALETLEFFEQGLLNGRINYVFCSGWDNEEQRWTTITLAWEHEDRLTYIEGEDLRDLWMKLKGQSR